jgi:hypothetical protein
MNVSVDLDKVATISCSHDCVMLQLRNPSGDSTEALDTELTETIAVTSSMKEARSAGTMLLGAPINIDVQRDSLFSWHRGGAFSGWGVKTPMKSQKAGRSTRRFFVYRDDTLSYFRNEPSLEDIKRISEHRNLKVTKGSSLRAVKKYLRDYVMLETSVDTMWFRPLNKELQAAWMKQVQRTLTFHDRKPFLSHVDQISTMWFHESSECCCVAVDGYVRESGDVSRVTLFRIRRETEVAPRKRPWFPLGRGGNDSDPQVSKVKTTYALNLYRSVDDFTVTQVIADLPENVELQCVRVVGDCVALGGTRGFVGFCTQALLRTEQPVPPQLILDNRQGLVHGTDTTITCINHCPMRGIIACGDDKGGVSIWLLSNPANVLLDSINPSVFGCSVSSIVFPPSRNYIMVGTSKGLYIVTYDPTRESGSWVSGLAPVRVGELHEGMKTASSDGRPSGAKVLSMVSYPRGANLRASTSARESEGSAVIWQLIQKPTTGRMAPQSLLVRASASVAWLDAHCDEAAPIVNA